jgi:hypothetical protein
MRSVLRAETDNRAIAAALSGNASARRAAARKGPARQAHLYPQLPTFGRLKSQGIVRISAFEQLASVRHPIVISPGSTRSTNDIVILDKRANSAREFMGNHEPGRRDLLRPGTRRSPAATLKGSFHQPRPTPRRPGGVEHTTMSPRPCRGRSNWDPVGVVPPRRHRTAPTGPTRNQRAG